ncbi:MAG: SMC-Scp complex subunit ScpB, partial [Candidatus Omnitrophota bacterium]
NHRYGGRGAMTNEEAKKIIEALLFSSSKPITAKDILYVIEEGNAGTVKQIVEELQREYEQSNRSFSITEIAGGYRMVTDAYYAPWIKKLLKEEDKPQKLSTPAMETLAIIAYRQPLTKSEIETIRGVNVDGVVQTLEERKLIKTSGRKEAPGRPFVYVTTNDFLMHFGLKSLEDLPRLKIFEEQDVKFGSEPVLVEGPAAENTETQAPDQSVQAVQTEKEGDGNEAATSPEKED